MRGIRAVQASYEERVRRNSRTSLAVGVSIGWLLALVVRAVTVGVLTSTLRVAPASVDFVLFFLPFAAMFVYFWITGA